MSPSVTHGWQKMRKEMKDGYQENCLRLSRLDSTRLVDIYANMSIIPRVHRLAIDMPENTSCLNLKNGVGPPRKGNGNDWLSGYDRTVQDAVRVQLMNDAVRYSTQILGCGLSFSFPRPCYNLWVCLDCLHHETSSIKTPSRSSAVQLLLCSAFFISSPDVGSLTTGAPRSSDREHRHCFSA